MLLMKDESVFYNIQKKNKKKKEKNIQKQIIFLLLIFHLQIYHSTTSGVPDITKDERYKACLLKSKPISVKKKLCYYQITHTKTHTQNFYKFILELVAELSMSSRDYFS